MIWYWQGTSLDSTWSIANFTDDYNGLGNNPATVPWTTAATAADDITVGALAEAFLGPSIIDLLGQGFVITGVCDLEWIYQQSMIYGGTFTGGNLANSGDITGGVFTGTVINQEMGRIWAGTFSATVENGTAFSTDYVDIYGGVFLGAVVNSSGGTNHYCVIYEGLFEGAVENNGLIYSGIFLGTVTTSFMTYSGIFNGGLPSGAPYGGYWWSAGSMLVEGRLIHASGAPNPWPYADGMGLRDLHTTSDIIGAGLL